MEYKYDVIIIGAGPAGLECAKQFIQTDLSVLIIEKNEIIGPKICAGGLTTLTKDFDIPEEKTRNFAVRKFYIGNRLYNESMTDPIRTIDRLDLGLYQLGQIQNSENIKVLTGTQIRTIDNNKVVTKNKETFYFEYLVGADGSNSIVRRYLGLKSKFNFGFYYNVPEVTNELIWCVNPKELKTGYIWVFPHQKHTNIGVYFNPKEIRPKKARKCLESYLNRNDFPFSMQDIKGSICNYYYQGFEFKNIFLVGDAAGLLLKGTGEGISFALISGREVGRKILNPNYKTQELDKILKYKRKHERMLKVLEIFPVLQTVIWKLYFSLKNIKKFQAYFGK
ncbi:MAG: FAD-dependent monooxygenase [Bacteroidota bacterium]